MGDFLPPSIKITPREDRFAFYAAAIKVIINPIFRTGLYHIWEVSTGQYIALISYLAEFTHAAVYSVSCPLHSLGNSIICSLLAASAYYMH